MVEGLVAFLIVLVVICVIAGILHVVVKTVPLPAPFGTIATYVIWGIAVVAILVAVLKYLVPVLP